MKIYSHFARIALVSAVLIATLPIVAQPQGSPPADSHFEIPPTDDGLPGAGPIRRYDWFRKLWVQRRSAWAKRVEQDKHALVFLGDSITQGWGDDMGGSFGATKVANRGISGDTTRGVLIRLDEDVLALDPDGVVILIGTNDLEENADPDTIAANLKLILAKLEEHNRKMPIILCQVFPSSESKKRPAAKIKEINRLYAAAVKGDPQITLVETWPLFANAQGDAKIEEFPDLLHPNKIGYAKWAAGIRPYLETVGCVQPQQENFAKEEGFEYLFNGRDLTGWGYRASAPEEIKSVESARAKNPNAPAHPIVAEAVNFDGQTAANDGRFIAKNGRLIDTAAPEFRRIQQISTTRDFPKDFVLKLEFRATPDADSGIFIRGPQLQCRDYLIAGPYKELKNYKAGDWNEIVITVKGESALCTCNGEVLEAAFKVPATGSIGLEGDRGQVEYRNIRIKEMP